jgi:small subunit ribosomal protein S6
MSRMVTAPGRAREYETIYILRPDIDAESADKLGTRLSEVVSSNPKKGKLTKVELWGRRRLAFDIAKHKRGVYVYMKYLGDGATVAEIERSLRLTDGVLKYQTVLVGNDVELAAQVVSDDDVKFERVELPPLEEDREDSRERQLGLIESERTAPRGDDEMGDMDGGDLGGSPDEEG